MLQSLAIFASAPESHHSQQTVLHWQQGFTQMYTFCSGRPKKARFQINQDLWSCMKILLGMLFLPSSKAKGCGGATYLSCDGEALIVGARQHPEVLLHNQSCAACWMRVASEPLHKACLSMTKSEAVVVLMLHPQAQGSHTTDSTVLHLLPTK